MFKVWRSKRGFRRGDGCFTKNRCAYLVTVTVDKVKNTNPDPNYNDENKIINEMIINEYIFILRKRCGKEGFFNI